MEKKQNNLVRNLLIVSNVVFFLLFLRGCLFTPKCPDTVVQNNVAEEISEKNNTHEIVSNDTVEKSEINEVAEEPQNNSVIINEEPTLSTIKQEPVSTEEKKENEIWEKAKKNKTLYSYNEYLKKFPNGKHKDEAEKAIVDYEVNDIFNKDYKSLPPMDYKTPKGGVNKSTSLVEVKNDTDFDLIIRYSGPQSYKVTLKSQEKKTFTLANGDYKMTATVNAEHVKNYGSFEKLQGMNYYSEFYLKSKEVPNP